VHGQGQRREGALPTVPQDGVDAVGVGRRGATRRTATVVHRERRVVFCARRVAPARAVALALAVVCGAVTSGLGYALWYAVLRQMRGPTAAVVQLSVPVIAIAAGALLLGEGVTPSVVIAAALVVGGIGWAVTAKG